MKHILAGLFLAAGALCAGCGEEKPADSAGSGTPPAITPAQPPTTRGEPDANDAPGKAAAAQPSGAAQGAPKVDEKKLVSGPGGLKYQVLKPGKGATAGHNVVKVHYTGWLENGTKFDSSRDSGQPIEFELGHGQVIKGWDEGVKGMKVGEQRRLVIPSDMAYGPSGRGEIPPNATLIFDVELMEVKAASH